MLPMKTVAVVLVAAVASCQQRPDAPADPPAAEEADPAAEDPADANSYVGMTLADASARADKAEIRWRIVEEDGKPRAVTMDHRPDRLNFSVAAGKVIRVTKG